MSRPRFRRHFLWDTVQPRFWGLSFCYVVMVIAAVSAALFLPLMLQLDHLPVSSPEAQRLADQVELLHSRFWPVVAVWYPFSCSCTACFFTSDRGSPL